MILKNHIDVSSVLRERVSQSYSNLVTRPTGVAVRMYIEERILGVDGCAMAVIDFSHVGMMDFSCADEIVAKLVLVEDGRRPKLVFAGLSESHLEAIDAVLERHGMALVSHEADSSTYVAVVTH
jgi:hypothetical protein